MNRERNRERLEKMPHRDFLDLAAIYYIPIEMGQDCSASLTMMDAHTAKWQVDADMLFSLACANTERLFPASVRSMEKILQDLCPGSPSLHETGMHVLRNNGSGGAAAMLNEGVLQWFAGKYGDFYIFPSSVHEVILHPVKLPGLALEKEGLLDMVREINREQVPRTRSSPTMSIFTMQTPGRLKSSHEPAVHPPACLSGRGLPAPSGAGHLQKTPKCS